MHLDWYGQNTTNIDFIYFFIVYLWILLPSIIHTCVLFFEKNIYTYIFLFSYFEQKELSFTFLNKMWTEAQLCRLESPFFGGGLPPTFTVKAIQLYEAQLTICWICYWATFYMSDGFITEQTLCSNHSHTPRQNMRV